MSPEKLVYMANQIGKFFASQGPDEAVAGIADHLRNSGTRAWNFAYWTVMPRPSQVPATLPMRIPTAAMTRTSLR